MIPIGAEHDERHEPDPDAAAHATSPPSSGCMPVAARVRRGVAGQALGETAQPAGQAAQQAAEVEVGHRVEDLADDVVPVGRLLALPLAGPSAG